MGAGGLLDATGAVRWAGVWSTGSRLRARRDGKGSRGEVGLGKTMIKENRRNITLKKIPQKITKKSHPKTITPPQHFFQRSTARQSVKGYLLPAQFLPFRDADRFKSETPRVLSRNQAASTSTKESDLGTHPSPVLTRRADVPFQTF